LDKKIINNVPHYLVSWKGYSDEENTWEPIENLNDPILKEMI
jgi:hypothetical protein